MRLSNSKTATIYSRNITSEETKSLPILNWNIGVILYFLAFGIWLSYNILYQSFYAVYITGTIYSVVRYGCLLLLLLSELSYGRYNIKSIIGLGISIGIIGILSLTPYSVTANSLIDMVLFIYCARNIDFDTLVRFALVISCCALAFVIISAFLGIIQNYVYESPTRTRYYLGFRYALYSAQIIFNITCLWIYRKRECLKIWTVILLLLINIFIYAWTDARLSFILSIVLILCAYLIRFVGKSIFKFKVLGFLFIGAFIISAALSIIITILYNPSITWMSELNTFLSNRISLGHEAIELYGINAFGHEISFIGNGLNIYGEHSQTGEYNYIDSLYVRVLIEYGWIFFATFIIFMTMISWHAWKNRDPFLALILVVIAVHCMIDDLSIYLFYNSFLLLIGQLAVSNMSNYQQVQIMKTELKT